MSSTYRPKQPRKGTFASLASEPKKQKVTDWYIGDKPITVTTLPPKIHGYPYPTEVAEEMKQGDGDYRALIIRAKEIVAFDRELQRTRETLCSSIIALQLRLERLSKTVENDALVQIHRAAQQLPFEESPEEKVEEIIGFYLKENDTLQSLYGILILLKGTAIAATGLVHMLRFHVDQFVKDVASKEDLPKHFQEVAVYVQQARGVRFLSPAVREFIEKLS